MQKTKNIALILGVLVMSFAIGYLAIAWTEPTQAPPGGNIPAPLNVSLNAQSKEGALVIGTNSGLTTGLIVQYGNVGIGTTDSGTYKLNVNGLVATGDLTVGGGSGKINAGTIDPIFEINGEKYATYVPDFAGGVRIETGGNIKFDSNGKYLIDFDNLEKGSDLWLFWQASNKNINDLVILLTPDFEGKVWYKKDGNKVIIYSEKSGEISYRLSTPRVDYQRWGNIADGQSLEGIDISKY